MLPSSLIILAFVLASSDAVLWSPSTTTFTHHALPIASKWPYANYLANCSILFRGLAEYCGYGGTNCPILTDRTPSTPTSEADNLFPSNATLIDKLEAFYYYNVDDSIAAANGAFYSDSGLHQDDFNNATNYYWQCKRLAYRHLFYYEVATTGQLDTLWAVEWDTIGRAFYMSGEWSLRYTTSPYFPNIPYVEDFYGIETASHPWTPETVFQVVGTNMQNYYQSLDPSTLSQVPYKYFYLQWDYVKILRMAYNAQQLFTGTTFVSQLMDAWTNDILPDTTLSNSVKSQIRQFIYVISQRWSEVTDPNERYYFFSEKFFEWSVLFQREWMLGLINTNIGQLGDLYYLNYFFGLPL